ncbi:MAG TPA: hypothetical protein VGK67_36680 [Myxococcales bacterium]|jgi:TolA-binding protein
MGPWLRGMAIFLAAFSTATARAQEEQPRAHPPDQSAGEQKPSAADQELLRLRKQVADLQAQLDQQRAEQAAAQQRQQQQIEALRQQAEAVAARGRAIEENRRLRIQWWNQAGEVLADADVSMMGGFADVGGQIEAARSLLARASGDAAGYGYAREASNGRAALNSLDSVEDRLVNGDLAGARTDLYYAVNYAVAARTLARSSSQPLYEPAP